MVIQLLVLPRPAFALDPATHVSGTLTGNVHWTSAGSPYVLDSTVTIPSGSSLTIDAGVIVKSAGAPLVIKGVLTADGTAQNPIYFTSSKDDALGGDTDGQALQPANGDWAGVYVSGSGTAGSTLSHATLKYGGKLGNLDSVQQRSTIVFVNASPALDEVVVDGSPTYGIHVRSGSAAITNLAVYHCGQSGLFVEGGATPSLTDAVLDSNGYGVFVSSLARPVLERVEANGNTYYPAYFKYNSTPVLADITGDGNGTDAIYLEAGSRTVADTLTLPALDLPYAGYIDIAAGATVRIDPGSVLKLSRILSYGTLIAEGTAASPIVATSIKDDSVGGDTDNAAASPAAQDWEGISLSGSGADNSRLSQVQLRYGGKIAYLAGYQHRSGLFLHNGVNPTVHDLTVSSSGGVSTAGVYIHSGSPVLAGLSVKDSWTGLHIQAGSAHVERSTFESGSTGVYVAPGASPVLRNCTVKDYASAGVHVQSGSPDIGYSDLLHNGLDGFTNIKVEGTSDVDARYNYWGRKTGPTLIEQATADCVPWLWYPFKSPAAAQVLGANTQCGAYGEPVNTSTGNFYYTATDLTLSGVGPVIALGRTYNHQDASVDGALGYGWNADFESFVQPQADGSAIVVYPGGARKTFGAAAGGTYTSPEGSHETLADRAGGGYELTYKDRSRATYAPEGWIERVEDRYGNAVTYSRTTDGQVTRIEGSGGRHIAFTYTGARITAVEDSAARTVTYGYDDAGDLTEVTDTRGETTRYAYDDEHRVLTVASPGNPTSPFVTNVYTDDKITTQYDGYGSEISFDYGDGVTDMTSNRGFASRHEFDDLFRLTRSVDEAGNAELRSYTASGFIETVTDGNGHVTRLGYDAAGNVTSARDGENRERTASYDLANDNLLWAEDEAGTRTTYSYDATGTLLTSITTPVGATYFDYFTNGLLKHLRSAGATTTYDYDASGNLTTVADALGKTSSFAYDDAGRMTESTDAVGNTTRFDYDAAGNLLKILDPLAGLFPGERHQVDFTYDADGNRETFTDAEGNLTRYHYDVMGNLVGVTDAASEETSYTYDADYNLASVIDACSNTTTYTYTPNDLPESVTNPLGHSWRFSYDGAGNVTETVYPDGSRAHRTYYPDDMLETLSFDTEPTSYEFGYTPTNWLSSVTDNEGRAFEYAYNPVGWLLQSLDTVNPDVSGGFTTSYAYDEAGRATGIRPSGEATRTYVYDLRGDLASLELPTDGAGPHTTYTYDDTRRRTSVSLPDGSVRSWAYDAASRLASVVTTTASGVLAFDYTRDANGSITAENDTRYTYDALSRLKTWYDPSTDTTTTYGYDPVGNLLSETRDGQTVKTFTYDAANRVSSTGYTYDARGNLTADPTRRYVWDAANRLRAVIDASTETTIASYDYDYLNRRISSTDASDTTTYFHYSSLSPNVIAETDDTGVTTASYAYDDRGNIHSTTRDGSTYYYHVNGHGDVIALSDSEGSIVNAYRYDPWGRILDASETVANPYRYAGYRFDEHTGLYYLWNRYYSPSLLRFLSTDLDQGSRLRPQTLNRYVYCLNNPQVFYDPSGQVVALAIMACVGAGAVWAGFFLYSLYDERQEARAAWSEPPTDEQGVISEYSSSRERCTDALPEAAAGAASGGYATGADSAAVADVAGGAAKTVSNTSEDDTWLENAVEWLFGNGIDL